MVFPLPFRMNTGHIYSMISGLALSALGAVNIAHGEPIRQVLPGAPAAVQPQDLKREVPLSAEAVAAAQRAADSVTTGSTPASAPSSAPVSGDDSEIQRFCSNIADAARDRRYSLQAAELKRLRIELDERVKALEAKRTEYEEWLKRREVFLARAQEGVVKIYADMKPDAAAERLALVGPELAAAILMKLEPRKASVIFNEMDEKAAATLTKVMASAARRVDPT